ncbi:hypothetical protein L1887_55102 [Cichorium endivia]|nr:hypothetical protein L1887_55102 [Cichorium endivia]
MGVVGQGGHIVVRGGVGGDGLDLWGRGSDVRLGFGVELHLGALCRGKHGWRGLSELGDGRHACVDQGADRRAGHDRRNGCEAIYRLLYRGRDGGAAAFVMRAPVDRGGRHRCEVLREMRQMLRWSVGKKHASFPRHRAELPRFFRAPSRVSKIKKKNRKEKKSSSTADQLSCVEAGEP